MTKMRGILGVLVLAVLVYSGLWHTTAFQAEKQAATTLAGWRDLGLRIEHGKIKLSGFPYRMVLTIDGISLRTREAGLDFGADSVMLVSHLWTPGHWVAEARNVKALFAGGALEATDGYMRSSYRRMKDGGARIVVDSLSTEDFSLVAAPGLQPGVSLENWELYLRNNPTTGANGDGLYENRFLDFKLTFETKTQRFDTEGGIMGPPVTDWTKASIGSWRDAGGLLELDKISLSGDGGALTGNASLTLDETFRLLGSASLQVSEKDALGALLGVFGRQTTSVPAGTVAEQVSVMMQMGTLTINGEPIISLMPVVN